MNKKTIFFNPFLQECYDELVEEEKDAINNRS
jgi:hypothetical protein